MILTKQQIQQKLESLKDKSYLLALSDHSALSDWVVVVPAEINQPGITSKAMQYEDRPEIGLVVSAGPDVTGIETGDLVFFGKYSHVQITYDDIQYLIMKPEDIYCVAKE